VTVDICCHCYTSAVDQLAEHGSSSQQGGCAHWNRTGQLSQVTGEFGFKTHQVSLSRISRIRLHKSHRRKSNVLLVGGFNPSEKY
jgi:hypothetical protein